MFAAATVTDWGALGTGLAIAFVAFMQVYTNWKANKIAAAVVAAAAKAEESRKAAAETAASVTKIETATNGNLHRLTTELEVAREKIAGLEKLVTTIAPPVLPAPPEIPKV